MENTSQDIITVLHAQHDRIRGMFDQIESCTPAERQHFFDDLRQFLAVHEAAEELVLRPVTSRKVSEIADERNAEEKRASLLLARLEDDGADSPGFMEGIAELRVAVEAHAEREETLELPMLQADSDERQMLGRRLIQAESLAPTHPHPLTTGSTVATAITGPFASMMDSAKEALRGMS